MEKIVVELKILVTISNLKKDSSRAVSSVYTASLQNSPIIDMSLIDNLDVVYHPTIVFKNDKLANSLSPEELIDIKRAVTDISITHIKKNQLLRGLRPTLLN